MSEEKPTFKVTDRRLFNADGSARDIERDTIPTHTAPTDNIINASANVAPSETTSGTSATNSASESPASAEAASSAKETNPLFLELMMFVAENSAALMSGHPQFGGEINLPVAKQFIDMLGALREKTSGNLSTEEQSGIDSLLSQLRMQYVQLSSAPQQPAAPRGFTGSDITGGR
ncbi:MAG: DUF1844 domain-containing protein [Pyrinomonadaceae bacterium]|nr:DUF1844 domain-containing protein [Pyrinomonadaceae bacterium]